MKTDEVLKRLIKKQEKLESQLEEIECIINALNEQTKLTEE